MTRVTSTKQFTGTHTVLARFATTVALVAAAMPAMAGRIVLKSGTVLPVDLTTGISSATAAKGDVFTAIVRKDIVGQYGLPVGTRVDGYVRDVRKHRGNSPGMLDLAFRRVRLPNGQAYPINGSLIGLDNKSVIREPNGTLRATPGKGTSRLTYVGYGAGAGLIVGLLTKHALPATIIGGGLGYLYGALQHGNKPQVRDVVLKKGTEIGVRLDRQVAFSGSEVGNNVVGSASGYRVGQSGLHRSTNNSLPAGNGNSSNFSNNGGMGIGVLVNGNNVNFTSNAQPISSHNTILVPAAPVLHEMHTRYSYNGSSKVLDIRGAKGTVRITAGSRIAVINGTRRAWLAAPAQMLNGAFYVPMQLFKLITNSSVSYDSGSETVVIGN